MKILHISTRQNWGGGEQQLLYLLQYLSHESNLLLCPSGAPLHLRAEKTRVKTFTFPQLPHLAQIIALPFRIWSIVRQNQPDLIHTHDSTAHTIAWLAARLWGIKTPLIVSRRVTLGKHRGFLSLLKYNHPTIASYICVSEAVRQSLIGVVGQNKKLNVVNSGVDPARFPYQAPARFLREEFQLPGHIRLIGNIASLVEAKDYPTFLQAAALLLKKRNDLRFIITGDGPQSERLKDLVMALNISPYVIFTGFRHDIERVLPSLDVFLFTSQSEGLGTIVLDAMACRVPVVATRTGGIPEMIQHEETGLLAPAGDYQALAESVARLLDDQALRIKIIQKALSLVNKFHASHMAEQTLDIYKKTLNISS